MCFCEETSELCSIGDAKTKSYTMDYIDTYHALSGEDNGKTTTCIAKKAKKVLSQKTMDKVEKFDDRENPK